MRILLCDPRPERSERPDQPVPTVTPADSAEWVPVVRADAGFVLACNAVSASNHAVLVAEWEDRQQRLKGWLARLEAEKAENRMGQMSDRDIAALIGTGQMSDRDFAAALIGTRHWEAMSAEVMLLLERASRCRHESAEKHGVIAACHARVRDIIGRTDERMKEVAVETEARMARLPTDARLALREDVAALAAIEASLHDQFAAVIATAVQKINAQTRRVLDLDQHTAGVSVKEWLCGHDLA